MSNCQQSPVASPDGVASAEHRMFEQEQAFDPDAYIGSEFVNPDAIDGVKQSLKETRDLGRVGGASADDFSPVTGVAWLIDMAEHYDCEVSGPYDRDTDDGGDYFLFHHRPKPPIPQGDLFSHPQDAG